jgi:hypothetical protein
LQEKEIEKKTVIDSLAIRIFKSIFFQSRIKERNNFPIKEKLMENYLWVSWSRGKIQSNEN